MAEAKDGCVKPSKGPIALEAPNQEPLTVTLGKEVSKMLARVGKPAPDFELAA